MLVCLIGPWGTPNPPWVSVRLPEVRDGWLPSRRRTIYGNLWPCFTGQCAPYGHTSGLESTNAGESNGRWRRRVRARAWQRLLAASVAAFALVVLADVAGLALRPAQAASEFERGLKRHPLKAVAVDNDLDAKLR